MDSFEALGNDGTYPQETSSLGRPIPGAACAILFSSENDEGDLGFSVGDGGIVNRYLGMFGVEKVKCHSALHSREHEIFDSHVGEGSASHDPVVSTAGTVAVEILSGDALGN